MPRLTRRTVHRWRGPDVHQRQPSVLRTVRPELEYRLPTDQADVDTLIDNGGLVTVQGPDASMTFVPNGSGGYQLSEGETGEETLTVTGSGSSTVFTYSEPADSDGSTQSDTQQITFAAASQPAGGPSIAEPGPTKRRRSSPPARVAPARRLKYVQRYDGLPKQCWPRSPAERP